MKYPQLVSMPSAVSDWLEEQLEARGIDAVVYTRYILSLLHTDSVDVILPDEEELHISQLKKEAKRSNGSRKRIRRSTEWWKNGHADPEKIKRLAAVECLMSASDQTFGIESLVDELCEKLKTINSENNSPIVDPALSKNFDLQQQQQQENCVLSPQELAKKYYAAFPPLSSHNNTINSPTKLITFVPKWISSTTTTKQKKQSTITATNNRRNNKEDKIVNMKARSTVVNNKQRFNNYFNRNHDNSNNNNNRKDCGKSMMKSVEGMNQWDHFSLFINNNKNSKLTNIINDWPKTTVAPISSGKHDNHCLNNNDWHIEDDLNMYEDLPVDISDLLDDSSSSSTTTTTSTTTLQHDETVELMNIANMRDTGKRGFIKNGTNITTSIWSNDGITSEFGSITINSNDWMIIKNNHRNNNNNDNSGDGMIEKNMFFDENWQYILPEKWSDIDDNSSNPIALSLIKLNHNKETSPFVEVGPKPKPHQYNPFKQIVTTTTTTTATINHSAAGELQNTPIRTVEMDVKKDDLLTSATSHFRPIKESSNNNNNNLQQKYEYSDGTTFTISRNFEKINYRRTTSGGLYLENDYAMKRKYYEYHNNNSNSNLTTIPTTQQPHVSPQTINYGLVLKFIVCQNDKECQTDDDTDCVVGIKEIQEIITNDDNNNKESYHINNNNNNNSDSNNYNKKNGAIVPFKCTCLPNNNKKTQQAMIPDCSLDSIVCPLHPQQYDNKSLMAEIIWKKQDNNVNNNNKEQVCEKCTKSEMWNTECMTNFSCIDDGLWDDKNLRSIWSGGEVCYSCLGRPPSTSQQTKLREDISQDGDQLLSDLSSIQKSYMESNEFTSLTAMETSYDINELMVRTDKKRRRHSLIMALNNNHNNNNINNNDNTIDESGIWSFASRLEEDCLIQMSTIPTLRSVTL